MKKLRHTRDWLLPTLAGPPLATWALVTLSALLGLSDRLAAPLPSWGILMTFGSIAAAALAAVGAGFDLLLLRLGYRRLPTGARAWMLGLASPVVVVASWFVLSPGTVESSWGALVALVLPVLLGPLLLRVIFGESVDSLGSDR